ncbi:MAG: serine/threonine protein kinase, partial [Gammaproteobacteria bacterium]|nr:serine/threonine protein kinase [Gammaproteobacteria bacterium]
MADFKTALHALARGDLDYEVVALNVVKLLKKKPHAAASMLEQLREAYNDGLLDADNFARLKKKVLDIAAPPDSTYVVVADDEDRENPDSIAAEARAAALAAQPQRVSTIDFDLSGDSQPSTGSSWDDMGSGPSAAGTGWSRDDAIASQKIEPGSTLKGRFALDEVLGVGGMGTVYKGRDLIKVEAKDLNPWVALKVLNEDFKKHPDSFIALQREASRQQKLAHPNIATVYDFDRTEDGTVFLTMELLEGTPLNTFIKKTARPRGGLPFEEAFPIIQGLGNALVYAHERNIVHSDFKPGNCFVTNDNTMKVLDFGIARAVKNPGQGDGEKTLFDPGELGALTPAYASLEMLEQKEPDPRDDIYALACVAYELLTGKHPFNKLPADKARDNGLAPPQVKGLKRRQLRGLQRGLAFTREERSQSVAEFVEELEGHHSPFKNPFIMVPAVAAVVLMASVFPVKNYLEEQHIQDQIRLAESGEATNISSVLEALPELALADQGRILVEAREPILAYYEARIREAVNLDKQRYDFQGAEQILYEVKQLGAPEPAAPGTYSDSSKVGELDDWLKEQFALAESALVARFNVALENGALLPEENADDIHDIRGVVAKIDPNHPLLRDPRLPGVFDVAINTAITEQDFEQGSRLASTGRDLLPGNRNLINLADKVTASRDKAERDAIIAERTAAIGAIDSRYRTLAAYLPAQDDIVALAEVDPSNPVIAQLSGTLRPLVEAEVESLSRTGAWGASQLLGADYGPVLKATGLRDLNIRVNRLRGRYGDDIFNIVAAVTGAVAGGRLNDAEAELGKLEEIAAGQPSTARARQQVARAYLRQARGALAKGDADSAEKIAERAARLDTDKQLADALDAMAAGVASGALPEVAPGTVEALAADLDQKLPAIASADDAIAALAVLDQLEAARPDDQRTLDYRAGIAAQAASTGAKLGQEGQWSDAIALVETTLAFVPESTELAGSLVQFQDGLKAANAAAETRFIEDARTRVAELLDQPLFDRDWNTTLEETLADIEDLVAPDDAWLAQAKADAAKAYVQQSVAMRQDERFAESASLLDRAARYAPELADIDTQRGLLASAEQAFEEEQREAQTLARIEALKQTFLTQTRARQVAGAAQSLEQLRGDLPADDPFIVSEAPAALATAYSRLAASKAEVQDFAAALKLAKAGLKENSGNVTLQRQVKEYNIKGTKQEINNSLARSGAIDLASVLEQIADMKKFDPVEYSREQDR